MKPSNISDIMDIAKNARSKDLTFNPLFSGEAGLGKSKIVQQWVKEQQKNNSNFGFKDLRIAYFEGPDFVGLPKIIINGNEKEATSHIPPDFWPTEGEGLILFEEPNRANSSVMNCMMQVLTDREVNGIKIPDGWMFAACINPDNGSYDVNTMDYALQDRFEIFEVEYDHKSFVDYIESKEWNKPLVEFIKSGAWIYKTSEELGETGKYISPRTFEKLNNGELSGAEINSQIHYLVIMSALGDKVGRDYYAYRYEKRPVTVEDLLDNKKESIKRLKTYCRPTAYEGGLVSITVQSIIEQFNNQTDVNWDLVSDVVAILPADQAMQLIKKCHIEHNLQLGHNLDSDKAVTFKDLTEQYPKLKKAFKNRMGTRNG